MAGFLYFRSGDSRPITKEGAAKLRLAYAFPGGLEGREVLRGPGGKKGYAFADPKRHTKDIGYFPDQQTWRKLPKVEGRAELWVGYWNDAKPGPEDLRRAVVLPGDVSLTFGTPEQWVIPTLTEFDAETKSGECQLPSPLDYDENGNLFKSRPIGVLGELWDAVHPVALGVCFGSDDTDIQEPDVATVRTAAFHLIRTNYVVDMPELIAMGCLLDDSMLRMAVMASCRGQWLIEALDHIQKKSDAPAQGNG